MRYSVTSQALCGAMTVSALAVPNTQMQKRVQHVDISSFKHFPTADPKVFFDKADDNIRQFFNQGMFNDGPMDKFGKWLDRPMARLEAFEDKLELQWDNLEEFFEKGQVKFSHNEFKEDFEEGDHDFKDRAKNTLKNIAGKPATRNRFSLDNWGDLFNFPGRETDQPTDSEDSGEDTTENTPSEQPTEVPSNDNPPQNNTPEQPTTTVAADPTTPPSPPPPPPPPPPPAGGNGTPGEPPLGGGSKDTNNGAAAGCDASHSHVRFEWDSYSRSDRTAFVQAIKCLQSKPSGGSQYTGSQSRYEDLVSVHRGMTANIHQTAMFLVWHRYFVWVFEQMLRDECAFDRAMPWWDETKHAGAFAQSDVFSDAWFGHLPAKTSDGQGTCIESGEFAGTTLHVGPGTGNSDHCLSRAVDESQTAQCNNDFTNSCLAMGSYDEFRDCFELGPHGYGHNGVGAVMAEVSASVGDPIFFMHHLFVDHTFRIWQNANPSRRTTISGCADKASPCTPITLDTKLSSSGLRPDVTVGQALNTLGGTFCYRYDY
ncbi:hypothetical protein F5B22DRAFT_228073 [Xylaria bambusicola]|uniref:uncharacterized protein n=1 Tax=Xylaria bambusicola TaxID=326684 RepID=UPI0020083DCE|nr:uncharacterized protein F5B22DRAFT_228073 [Xylaria bambusicola]KAI0514703.1 hypothetical protein F5B22DRAFT_228073 [Xylaria bambusicola]